VTTAAEASRALQALADPAIAQHSRRFFRTGPGEYGEGDQFLGIRVPDLRRQVRPFASLPLSDVRSLLHSPWHEERLFALLLLVHRFQLRKITLQEQQAIFELYLANRGQVNNWDLVDSSAHQLVGGWLWSRPRALLYELAASDSLWDRRIAIISCYHFIKRDDFADTLALAALLRKDPEDLMHKATGWMLREVGNRDRAAERGFLQQHYQAMPRTMLRYAIEKFPEDERQAFLKGTT
jgi:3-methyladenine DNA glycosylase AlkD